MQNPLQGPICNLVVLLLKLIILPSRDEGASFIDAARAVGRKHSKSLNAEPTTGAHM